MTCTAPPFGDHDYSQPPHNTPDGPRDAPDQTPCQAHSAGPPFRCRDQREYELVIYQIATHDWIRMFACAPCLAAMRKRHLRLGPRGRDSNAIAAIRNVRPGGERP